MAAFLVPLLWGAGLGALVDGLVSAVTATGSASPEDIEEAKRGFMEVGMSEEAAQRMAEEVASEVTGGDRAAAAATGALRGGLLGAAGGAVTGGLAKAAGSVAPKLKSFLGRGAPTPAAPALSPSAPAVSAPSLPVGAGGGVRRSGMAMGDAEAVAAQKVGRPAEMRQEILGELEKRPGELAYRKELATKDDGLQGLIDDVMPRKDTGPIPEFLPGEMVSKTPSASLAPWEGLPEVEAAIVRKALAKYGKGKPPVTEQEARDAVALADYFAVPGRRRPPSFLSRVGD